MRLYNPRTNLWELPTHFKPRNTFVLDPIPLEEVLQRHPEEEYSPCYSTGELSETRYTVAEIAEAMQRESQSSNPKHPETHRPAMHYTNGTPKQGTAHCLNPATGKWELPTHYLAYNSTTETWSEPIRAEDAATLTAETILTPILTGRGYGEQTTAGALAAWLSSKPEIQEKPTKKGLMDILNTPIGEILSNPRPHPIGELLHGTEEQSPISITADTTYHLHDAASDTWSATTYTLGELMRLPDTSASTLIRPAGSEATITLAQARQHWKADGMEETSTGKTPTARQSAEQRQKETDRLNQLPSEIRAADYLLRHTQLADTIAAAKEFFQKAAAFITFVLILNIAAIIILLIAFMVSASK